MIRASTFTQKWPIVRLGDVVNFLDHKRVPITKSERTPGKYQYYGANGSQGTINDYIFDEPLVLVAEDGGNFGHPERTIAYIAEGKYWVNNHAHVLQPKKGLDLKYLCRVLEKYDVTPFVKGATRQKLSKTDASRIPLPLPPLETQKQIAAVLEKADQLRKDCQQMEQELNSLAQSVFIDMFGDPVTNPKGWEVKPLSSIVEDFEGGKSLVAADDESTLYKNKVLKISSVTSGEFKPEEVKPLPNEYEPPVEHFVKKDDLLFSRANTTELVGATTMLFEDYENLLLPDKLWRFVWEDKEAVSPVFIWRLLCDVGMRREISKLSSGSGGSMKNISKGKLKTLPIILPKLELQKKFEKVYMKLRKELADNAECSFLSEQAFNSLMQRAFKGELNLTATV